MFVHCTYMIYINACDGHRTFFGADGFLHPLGPPRGWGTRIRGGFGSGEYIRGREGTKSGQKVPLLHFPPPPHFWNLKFL